MSYSFEIGDMLPKRAPDGQPMGWSPAYLDGFGDARHAAAEIAAEADARLEVAQRMADALAFYADPQRYHGPNQPRNDTPDKWSDRVGLTVYRLDVTRDAGAIARAALAAWKEANK